MKFLLIAAALNLNITYPNADVCEKALETVLKNDPTAICIPAGEDKATRSLNSFIDLVKQLQDETVK